MSLYVDFSHTDQCVGILARNGEMVIPTGTTVSRMSASVYEKEGRAYDHFFARYGVRFLFDGDSPLIDFYAVPRLDVAAIDEAGGFIASVGCSFDLQISMPLVYVSPERNCLLITEDSTSFLSIAPVWRQRLRPYDGVQLFPSRSEAAKYYNILDLSDVIHI